MQARCQRCQTIFDLPHFGLHRCPGCGTEVQVLDPRDNPYAPPMTATQAAGFEEFDAARFQPTPWERRGELGRWKALRDTVGMVFGAPQQLLQRTDWRRADGLLSLYFWVAVVPQWVGALLSWLISNPGEQLEQMKTLYASLGQAEVSRALEQIEPWIAFASSPAALGIMLVAVPATTLLTLYLLAGVTHLVLLVTGRASGGWTATFKVFVYASCPLVLSVVPSCGAPLAMLWSTVLQVLGLSPAHRITVGAALGAVVGMHLVFIVLFCGLPSIALVGLIGAMGGGL